MMKNLDYWLKEKERDLIKDISRLIQIPSVAKSENTTISGMPFGKECKRVLDCMAGIARQKGMDVWNDKGYSLSITVGEGKTLIGIFNHLDVVPAGKGWLYPPFACTEKNGYLVGRGVQDNKGPAMAVFYALCYAKENNLLTNIRVRQILGCQEESGMKDVEHYLANCEIPAWSFVADCGFPVCCGEKGRLHLQFQSKDPVDEFQMLRAGTVCNSIPSFAEAKIQCQEKELYRSAQGSGGHAAFPEGCKNAVHDLCTQLLELPIQEKTRQKIQFLSALSFDGYGTSLKLECKDDLSGKLTFNLGVLSLENGYINAEVDIRYPVSVEQSVFFQKIKKEAEAKGFDIWIVEDDKPYYMDEKSPFVELLMSAWKETTGKVGKPFVMGGGTYARKIPNAVAFGPGAERDFSVPGIITGHGNCHCADEAESIENIKSAIRVYVNTLIKLNEYTS